MKRFLISAILVLSASLSPSFAAENSTSVSSSATATASNPYNKSATSKSFRGKVNESPLYKKAMANRSKFYNADSSGGDSKIAKFMGGISSFFINFSETYYNIVYAIAFGLFAHGVYAIKTTADANSPGQSVTRIVFTRLLIIFLLLNVPIFISVISNTLGANTSCGSTNYAACAQNFIQDKGELYNSAEKIFGEDSPFLQQNAFEFVKNIILIIQILGFIFFIIAIFDLLRHVSTNNGHGDTYGGILTKMLASAVIFDLEYYMIMLLNWWSNFV